MGLGFYISDLSGREIDDMFMTINGAPVPVSTVNKSQADQNVLEADVETAWKAMGLRAGWAGEIYVKLFLENA